MADNHINPLNGLSQQIADRGHPGYQQPQAHTQPTVSAQAPTQQKRQHSNSYQMPNTLKRSVTQPTAPSVLQVIPAESSRATTGTTTPANGSSLFPTQHQSPAQAAQVLQQQQQQQPSHQQQFSIQQQVPQFKPTFDIAISSPTPQIPAKDKKFSQTFVNQTYSKPKTPDMPQSPSLSLNKIKFDTTSYLNDDRTDVNDFNDTNSLAYTQTLQTSHQHQQPHQQVMHQASTRQNPPHPSQLPPPNMLSSNPPLLKAATPVIMKEANAESPGSTISEASTNPAAPPVQPEQPVNKLTDEEQQLITKLQDTYKNIIRLENNLQRKCAALNLPQRLDMTELWEIYNIDIQLLNAYYDFLLYALSSGKSGKQIVEVYRIPRRLWVYGIVTFLDVLKNVVSIFIEHDICSSFIGYAFNILSGLSDLEMEGWLCEKLGDLSRMAIALYPSRYIDWKISSEYWYATAMKTQYGFGKIYYHIATVQLDSLDALVNIGRSVFCRDTFVPTAQYMRMVIDNINQRSYVDLPVLDFIKVHKILLSNDTVSDVELNKLITYYARNFGIDNNSVDFFVRTPGVFSENIVAPDYSQDNDYENKFHFWFQRGSSFALVNIFQIVGFGNSANPFARLFGLLEALKERKEKKDRKVKRKTSTGSDSAQGIEHHDDSEPVGELPRDLSIEEWFATNASLNRFSIKVATRMTVIYLKGPLLAALPMAITTLYFFVAVGLAMKKYPNSKPFFETIIPIITPLNSLIPYLNELLDVVRSKPEIFVQLQRYENENPDFLNSGFLKHFEKNETLLEVWKCWGSLWFDAISLKEEYSNPVEAGIAKADLLDVPVGGPRYESNFNNERIIRVLLLASYVADNFNFGIKRFDNFRFGFQVDDVLTSLECSDKTREFVGNAHGDIFREARAFELYETVKADPACENIVKFDVLQWLKADESALAAIDQSQTVNYADNDADSEDDEEEEDDDDDDVYEDDYEDTDVDDQSGINHISTASTSFTHRPTPSVITADSGILVGRDVTYFVLDTNMWLKHCGRLFKCVKSRLFKLVVPLVVFQELRSLRCSPDATVADAGTRAVLTLRQLASEGALIPLKMNGTEAPSLNDVTDFESNKAWMQSMDDTIINATRLLHVHIAAAYNQQGVQGLDSVNLTVLITEDRNMRLKSRTRNVAAFQGKWFFDVCEKFSEGKLCTN